MKLFHSDLWRSIRKTIYNASLLNMKVSQRNFSGETKAAISAIVGVNNISVGESILHNHSKDESYHARSKPDAVVWVESVFQLCQLSKYCYKSNIKMIPFGSGTGLEGGCIPVEGGLVVNLMKLDKILDFNPEDFDVTVQAGVTRSALNYMLKSHGLWFPIDPGADASLCGMCATNASGTNALKYGAMKHNVLNLEIVLPNGDLLHTGGEKRRSRKTSAGYNLTELMVGSEGTLGFITSATLKVYPVPSYLCIGVCSFSTLRDAIEAVTVLLQCALPVARVELLDADSMIVTNKYNKTTYTESPTLFLELHGSSQVDVDDLVKQTSGLLSDSFDTIMKWTSKPEDRTVLWKCRHNLYYSILAACPGKIGLMTDACVPISHLPDIIIETQKDIAMHGLFGPCFGHVGDGNFHAVIMFNPEDINEKNNVMEVTRNLANRAQSLGGTCTGEHGIGLGKKSYLMNEVGEKTYSLQRSLKTVFDPKNLLNPGKIFS